jgi:regulator of replication initiation timing
MISGKYPLSDTGATPFSWRSKNKALKIPIIRRHIPSDKFNGMKLVRALSLLGSLTVAAALTTGFYLLDAQRGKTSQAQYALSVARQIVTQVEGITLEARKNGEKDPIGFAARLMSQGADQRPISITKTEGEIQGGELFRIDMARASFEYSKLVAAEHGIGVRIQMSIPKSGFLGARSRVANDLAVSAIFATCFILLLFLTNKLFKLNPTSNIRQWVLNWAVSMKRDAEKFSVHVREMVRHATKLALAASQSRQSLSSLRERIHGGLTKLHETMHVLRETQQALINAETVAQSAVTEANRLGMDAKHLAETIARLQKLLQHTTALQETVELDVHSLELELEPWATDSDMAFHVYDDLFATTRELNESISDVTGAILEQAKLLNRFTKVAEPSDKCA